jgi:hypothetical protein
VANHDSEVLVSALVGNLIVPILRTPANRSRSASTSTQTRVMIAPTVRQAIRMSSVTALFEHWGANHAT